MKKVFEALDFAKKKHGEQMYGKEPYLNHITNVLDLGIKYNCSKNVLIGCVLHDTLEDTETTYTEIELKYGQEVAEIVYCVTDELGRDYSERKKKTYPKIKSNNQALIVKLLDRISNVQKSIENSPKMLKKYIEQHQSFCDGLYDIQHPPIIQNLFEELINLIHTHANYNN